MSAKNISSKNKFLDIFILESNKIQEDISKALMNLENLYLEDIVGLYFNMINISSIAKAIKQNNETVKKKIPEETLIKIQETQNHLHEKFNETLHPLLISTLEKRIIESKSNLKKANTNQKSRTKKEIEDHAKNFEDLRRIMSTKEFVIQYAKASRN